MESMSSMAGSGTHEWRMQWCREVLALDWELFPQSPSKEVCGHQPGVPLQMAHANCQHDLQTPYLLQGKCIKEQ